MPRPQTVLGVLFGAALGGAATWWSLARAEGPSLPNGTATETPWPRTTPDPTSATTAESAARTAADEIAARPANPTETTAERADGALFTTELKAFATAEIARGWQELRKDEVPPEVLARALADYEETLRTHAHDLGRTAAEERNAADERARLFQGDDVVALLRTIRGDEPEAKALVGSDRLARLVATRGGGTTVDGTAPTRGQPIANGSIVRFPAGVFDVPDLTPMQREPYPDDLTVEGAGIDATLLMWSAQRPHSPLRRLSVRDCTLFVDSGVTDIHAEPATMSFARVRFVGFDCGAGGSVAFYLAACALHAVDCRFEGGYGRNPQGYANVLRSSSACLLRFERCRFDRVDLDDAGGPSSLFVEYALTEMLARQPSAATFVNCRYDEIAKDRRSDDDYRRRDLNALFPQWEQRRQRR